MRRGLVLTLALLSVSAGAQLAFTPSSGEGKQIFLKLDQKLIKLDCPAGAKPLSWSSDGRWLALGQSLEGGHYKLALVDTDANEPRVSELPGENSAPSWAPDGERFVYESVGKGILIHSVRGDGRDLKPLIPSGKNPLWAPHGDLIAILPTGGEAGVILCNSKGGHERHLATKLKASRLAWAPDGLHLAVVSSGAVWLLSASGRTPERLYESDDAHIEFSPDGAHLLCQEDQAWGTIDIATKTWRPLPVEFSSTPAWSGSHQVIGVSQEHLVGLDLNGSNSDPDGPDEGQISAFALGGRPLARKSQVVASGSPRRKTTVASSRISAAPRLTSRGGGARGPRALEYDGVSREIVVVPMLFPVCGKVEWSDTFLTSRDGGGRRHHGQDLMAPKMRPLVAAFDGVVKLTKAKGHNYITLSGDDGWSVTYMHVNNDTPGTEDGKGTDLYAFAPGLHSGDRVVRGQLVGFCGNSGNAKGGPAHCHFELSDRVGGGVLNAFSSLKAASHVDEPLTIDPCPSLRPAHGEVRWDVVVRSVDIDKGTIVAELIARTLDGELKVNLMPVVVRIHPAAAAVFRSRTESSEPRSFADITPGTYLSVVGLEPEPGNLLEAKSIALGASRQAQTARQANFESIFLVCVLGSFAPDCGRDGSIGFP